MEQDSSSVSYLHRIDYSEVLPIIVTICVIVVEGQVIFTKTPLAIVPLVMVGFLVICTLVMDFFDYGNNFMAYASVASAGLIAGYRCDVIIVFVMVSLVCIRVLKSYPKAYIQLAMLSIMSCFLGFFIIYSTGINNKIAIGSHYQIILLFTFGLFIVIDYINMNHSMKEQVQNSENRLQDIQVFQQRLKETLSVINSLSLFLPDQIRQPIIQEQQTATLSSKRIKVTLFFSDIKGFTDLSDNISADALNEILNVYMDRMTLVAKNHGAVLDKFIGDGMMCFFGTDNQRSGIQDSAIACVAMALDMRREMRNLRRLWRDQGYDLHLRMGINTGYCHVGNFGSKNRMSYTAIGKEVNLASRLEGIANTDDIIVSQSTFEYISYEYTCEMVGDIKLKGFDNKVRCYRVLDKPTSELKRSQWVDHDLPGFNLHLNFKDIKGHDYNEIRQHLYKALERVDSVEEVNNKENF